MPNPWEMDWSKPLPGVQIKPSDPRRPYEGPLAAAQLEEARLRTEKARRDLQNDPNNPAPDPYDALTGNDYLKHMTPAEANQVRALAEGRMAFPTGRAAASPYWQKMLSAVAHYDPTFDAVNYNARNGVRRDFTSGKSAQNIKALNTAIGHLGQLYDQIDGTASHGGLPGATAVNAIENALAQSAGDSGITKFKQTAGALSGELTQVYRQSGGAEADIQRYLGELSPNASREQKVEAVKNMLGLLKSRLDALNDQYVKGMGTDKYGLPILDDHAKGVIGKVDPTLFGPGDMPGGNSGGPPPTVGGGGGMDRTPQINPSSGGGTQTQVATKDGQTFDPVTAGAIERMILAKKSPAEIQAAFPDSKIDPAQIAAAQAYAASHPGYHGFVNATKPQNLTGFQQLSASPLAAYFAGAGNAATLGFNDEIGGIGSYLTGGDYTATRDRLDANKKALAALNPKSDFLGNLAGGAAVDTLAGGLLPPGIANAGKGPFQARDAVIGGIYGAGENNDNRLGGATGGATLGGLAGGAGRTLAIPVGAASRRIGGMMGRTGPAPLSPGETAVMNAVDKASIPDVQAQLSEAQSLGVPMSLADTHPELTSLGGAAVRRSPTADKVAQDALLPRSRGQIDRFGQAINRDLGPTGNVPLLSDNLEKAASAQAKPLYQEAYGAGQVNDPQINTLLQHPVLRDAFDGAQQLHANDVALAKAKGEQPPPPLAQVYEVKPGAVPGTNDPVLADKFAPSPSVTPEAFNVVTPPDVRTIDYIKRSLDRQIEAAYAGDSKAKMNLPFLKGARELLLSRTDSAVPAYGKARAAYGGNMDASEALQAGKAGVTADPNEFGMTVGDTAPGNIPQLQLGFRSGLLDQGNRLRYSTNPFEAVLGTPAAEQRLATAFPNSEGVPNLLRQRDMERQLARSTNDVLGNSKTAQRGIADQAFGESGLPNMLLDAGVNLATGQVPTGLLFKKGALDGIKGVMKMGVGKRAVAKADEIAPILFNTDPTAASASLDDLTARNLAYQAYVNASRARPRQVLGMLGAQSARQWAGGN